MIIILIIIFKKVFTFNFDGCLELELSFTILQKNYKILIIQNMHFDKNHARF